MAALGAAAAAVLSGGSLFAVAAWIFAVLPIGYLVFFAVRRSVARPAGVAGAAALAILVGGSTVLAIVDCGQRIEPRGNLAGCDLRDEELAGIDLTGADTVRCGSFRREPHTDEAR